jgi:hypothetical protein
LNDLIATGMTMARVGEYGADPPFLVGIAATRQVETAGGLRSAY